MSVVHLDQKALMSLKDLMEDEFASLLSMFLEDAQMNMQKIERALNEKDKEAIRSGAHAIKGSASNVGAIQLSALAANLENQIKLGMGDFDSYAMLMQQLSAEFNVIKKELMLAAAA